MSDDPPIADFAFLRTLGFALLFVFALVVAGLLLMSCAKPRPCVAHIWAPVGDASIEERQLIEEMRRDTDRAWCLSQ